jgi:hypothetical protein
VDAGARRNTWPDSSVRLTATLDPAVCALGQPELDRRIRGDEVEFHCSAWSN